jgi:serine/threonine protein kinase
MTPDSLGALEQVVEVADRFEAAWRKGGRPRIEDYLEVGTGAPRFERLHLLVGIELEIRRGYGDIPRLEEYLTRFPNDRELLEDAFGVRATGSSGSPLVGAQSPSPTMPQVPGYRVVKHLGSGGFSEVWLAQDLNVFGRQVALKMIKPRTPPEKRRSALEALKKEAELLVSVRHPNLVHVLNWIGLEDDPVLVLQYVRGGCLSDRLEREGSIGWQVAGRYVADVGEGLLCVHARGIVHRDVKPANILWDTEIDEAILTDLGVGVRLTEPNRLGGTIPYMALEAFDGIVTPALDVYGLAATFFTLVTGQTPFMGSTIAELRLQARRGLPDPDPRCSVMPEPLERLVRTGLSALEQRPALGDFVSRLRGTLNQLLVDTLIVNKPPRTPDPTTELGPVATPGRVAEPKTEPEPPEAPGVALHLRVSRQVGPGRFVPIASTRPEAGPVPARDMKKVPPAPERVQLRTGDLVRIEVVADRPGSITVFNVGPTGNLNLLFPDEPSSDGMLATPVVRENQPIQVGEVEMTPPAGRERLFAVWSRSPISFGLDRLHRLIEERGSNWPASQPYIATRDMKRVQQSVQQLRPEDWHSVALELEHSP